MLALTSSFRTHSSYRTVVVLDIVFVSLSLSLTLKMGKLHPNYSTDLKERVVKAKLESNLSYAAVSRLFTMPVTTVKDLVKKYQTTGTVVSKKKGGSKRKTTPRLERHLAISAKKNPFQTERHLQELAEGAGTSISRSTVSRRLNEQGLFCRKPRKAPFHKKNMVIENLDKR